MPVGSSNSVYVSYSWGAEEETRLVDKLEEACTERGIELQRDKKRIGYCESIRAYMDELGAGRHVVLDRLPPCPRSRCVPGRRQGGRSPPGRVAARDARRRRIGRSRISDVGFRRLSPTYRMLCYGAGRLMTA